MIIYGIMDRSDFLSLKSDFELELTIFQIGSHFFIKYQHQYAYT